MAIRAGQRLSFGRDLGERAVAIEYQPLKWEAPAKRAGTLTTLDGSGAAIGASRFGVGPQE